MNYYMHNTNSMDRGLNLWSIWSKRKVYCVHWVGKIEVILASRYNLTSFTSFRLISVLSFLHSQCECDLWLIAENSVHDDLVINSQLPRNVCWIMVEAERAIYIPRKRVRSKTYKSGRRLVDCLSTPENGAERF